MKILLLVLFVYSVITKAYTFPQTVTDKNSFIVQSSSDVLQHDSPYGKEAPGPASPSYLTSPPKIYEMHISSNVSNRYANTLITSKVRNYENTAQEAVFSIILPKKAFISKFLMNIGGKDYNAYVREKKQAERIYHQALASGRGAGLVAANTRDSNRITVSVNTEPQSEVIFLLTYEELLERKDNQYELVINIHPKQPVDNLAVVINLKESKPLTFVKAPPIRSGNELSKMEGDLDPRAQIHYDDPNSAAITFNPNRERQKEIAQIMGTDAKEGLSGQFLVQYDVERNANGGEVLLRDGYFVHFFAPPHVKPLPKYVLFVLDTSGSMYGTKIEQLKTAMESILSELRDHDKFHLIEFNSVVNVFDLQTQNIVQYPSIEPSYDSLFTESNDDIRLKSFGGSSDVNSGNINQANRIIQNLDADGGTNIADALKVALHLVEVDKSSNPSVNAPQPMIIFLTDGDATVGVTDPQKIISQVEEQNKFDVPIFTLSFGDSADRNLLQKLSLRNSGFSRHIYEAADASLQLQDFYKQISSPVMSNVTFQYVDEAKEVSKSNFPILFEGSELVVVGQLDKNFNQLPTVTGEGANGTIELTPEVRRPVAGLERLWAYLTIQQLLEDREKSDNKRQIEEKALNLALKYSFVTPVSSLVVVKPNSTDIPIEPMPAETETPVALELDSSPQIFATDNSLVATTTAPPPPTTLPPQILLKATTTPPPPPMTLPPFEELKLRLPWLNGTLTDKNDDVIVTSTGISYKLGLNETSANDEISCPETPKDGSGVCKFLHECSDVHYYLTNIYIFQQFHCDIRGYAGVCCPRVISN